MEQSGRGFDEHGFQDGGTHPNLRKEQQPPTRGDLSPYRPIEMSRRPDGGYAVRSRRRPRAMVFLGVLVVVLLLVIGVLAGMLLLGGGGSGTAAAPTATPAAPTTTSPPTTSAAPTRTTSPAEPDEPTTPATTGGASALPVPNGPPVVQQLRVTYAGQDLDRLLDDVGDRRADVAFSADNNTFDLAQATAKWAGAQPPSPGECVREIQLQPLSGNEYNALRNSPPSKVCTYTTLGNLVYLESLGAAEGDGTQVSVTVWQIEN